MRHAETNGFGKCDTEIKVCLDESTHDELVMLARLQDQTKSQYIRNILHLHVYGFAEVSRANSRNGMPTKGRE